MDKKYLKNSLVVLIPIVIIIIMVVTFNIANSVLSNNSPKNKQNKEQVEKDKDKSKPDLLAAPRNDQAVRYTVQGSIKGNEQHNSIRITIDRKSRKVEVLQGFSGQVVKSKDIANTQEAYQAFVDALNGAGFTTSLNPEGRGSETQSCPLGQRYIFELNPGRSGSHRTWSNSCGARMGTFGGNKATVQNLFQRQIPEYSNFVSGVKL